MDGRTRLIAWLVILSLALGVRLAAGMWWQSRLPVGTQFFFGDSESYWQLGRTIAEGKPYEYVGFRIFRTPGYPIVLSPLFLLFGPDPPVLAARGISALLGTASVAAVMALARSLFNERVAILAGAATAVDPGAITLGVFVLSEAPFCPLMVLNIWAWILAWKAPDPRTMFVHAAWGGVAAGLATLMRPSWLLFVPFAAVMGVAFFSPRQKQVTIAATTLLALAVTMTPWWVRNYSITGRFIPTTLEVGASLHDGLGPQADGSSNMAFKEQHIAELKAIDAIPNPPPALSFEERLDDRLRSEALRWAATHPSRVLQLAGIKLLRMWTPWPHAADLGGFTAKLAIAAGYLPLIGLGLIGAWQFGRRDWSYALLLLPAVYLTLLHMIFVSSLRYRQPAMLLIAILAAAVVVDIYNRWNSGANVRVSHGSDGASPSQ